MVELSRVPGPRSPFDGRWGTVVGLVLVALATAIVKPWNMPNADPAQPIPFTTEPPAVAVEPTPPTVRYDPAGFGDEPPAPAWEIWAADNVTGIRFVGPPDGFATPSPDGTASRGAEPAATAVVGGPVIEIGSADELGAFAVNAPRDVHLAAVRLWRFTVGGDPERVELRELDRPWPADHFRVFGQRAGGLAPGTLPAWRPGLYRLDLLIDPVDRIRSLLLVVTSGDLDPVTADPAPAPSEPLDVALLRRLPEAATIWAFGSVLTGWSRDVGPDACGVAEIWRAKDVDAPCHPIPLGRPVALGVNLPGPQSVASIRLSELDPLPGPVASIERTTVDGRAGVALVEVSSPGLTDGIYRLDVVTSTGHAMRWYVEVGPDPLG